MSRSGFRLSRKLLLGFGLLGLVMAACYLAPLGPALRLVVQSDESATRGTELLQTTHALAHVVRDTVHHATRFRTSHDDRDAGLVRGRIDQLDAMLRQCRTAQRQSGAPPLSDTPPDLDRLARTLDQFKVAFAELAAHVELLRSRQATFSNNLAALQRHTTELRNRQHWALYDAVHADAARPALAQRANALVIVDTLHDNVRSVTAAATRAQQHDEPEILRKKRELLEDMDGLTGELSGLVEDDESRTQLGQVRTAAREAYAAVNNLLATWDETAALAANVRGPSDALLGRAMVAAELLSEDVATRSGEIARAARRLRSILLASLAAAIVLGVAVAVLVTAGVTRDVQQVVQGIVQNGDQRSATPAEPLPAASLQRMQHSIEELNRLVGSPQPDPRPEDSETSNG